ncbi:hypothetical protein [Rufibacter sp. LB8]|uniref:hypothetical protein n=1 Tax=Rufibacter sp. LB8 TaxID=2777781 RepID=UPI00178C3C0C|nr:hypothetical protein [Rufibacter sp. LB8]
MEKRYIIKITALVLLTSLFWGVTIDRIKIDGISGEVWELFLSTDTKYSDGYSHAGFNKIKVGMTEKEVKKILGEPLIRWTPYRFTSIQQKEHYIGFQYSQSPSDTHYRIRQVYLNNGTVAEVIGSFYVD